MCRNITNQFALIFNDGNKPWSTTTLATSGPAVKNAMVIPEKTSNRYLYIDSFTVLQNQVVASLEKATRKKWHPTHQDAEQKKVGWKIYQGKISW